MVVLRIDAGNITIEGSDHDFAVGASRRVATEPMTGSKTQESMTIGFKAKQLISALQKIGGPFVSLNLNNPDNAGVFEPVSEGDDKPTQMALVMPMLVNE
jgi:DNA polymerase III sliding clamp (beta) subunit (PCNA family)